MSLLSPKVILMSVSTTNTYIQLQNFRKLGKNAKLSKKRTLPTSGQNLFPQWCPLIRDYPVISLDFLVWKVCGKAQFSHNFGRSTRNYGETVPFHKLFTPGY